MLPDHLDIRHAVLALALLCTGCGGAASPPAATPSPTIAALVLPALPEATPTPPPSPTNEPARPTAQPAVQPQATPAQEPFVYLWPAYLPEGMQLAPAESRVAREGEIGAQGLGFYLLTFNAGQHKLVLGGGATESFPLSGQQRRITIGTLGATLTTNGDQRQLVFDVPAGKLFVYSFGLSEQEVLRVAESLAPIGIEELRQRMGAP